MTRPIVRLLGIAGLTGLVASFTLGAATLPGPTVDESRSEKKTESVVLAGGCFWGVQAVFSALKGVTSAVSGYAGGSKANGAAVVLWPSSLEPGAPFQVNQDWYLLGP